MFYKILSYIFASLFIGSLLILVIVDVQRNTRKGKRWIEYLKIIATITIFIFLWIWLDPEPWGPAKMTQECFMP